MKRTYAVYSNSKSLDRYAKKRKFVAKRERLSRTATPFNGAALVPRGLANKPFPKQRTVSLRYCTNISLDAAVGAVAKYYFRANSLFDPDQSGTGHQPYGFDTLASIYNHYNVLSASITVEGVSNSPGTVAGNGVVGILISDDNTVNSDIDTLREVTSSNWTVYDSQTRFRVSNKWDQKSYFPATYQALGASVAANPTEESYFTIYATSLSVGTEPAGINMAVTIDFIARMWEQKDLGQS